MNIHPIHIDADYKNAMSCIEDIFDSKPGTPEGDELEILGILVDEYESRQFQIDSPDPIEAVKFRMDQLGLNQSDLARMVGSKSRAS